MVMVRLTFSVWPLRRSAAVLGDVRWRPGRWRGSLAMSSIRALTCAFAGTGRSPQCSASSFSP